MPIAYIPVFMLDAIQALEAKGFKVEAHDEEGNASLYLGQIDVIITKNCTNVDMNQSADRSAMCAVHYNTDMILQYPNLLKDFLKSIRLI